MPDKTTADKCLLCGKSNKKLASNPAYPGKFLCVDCLNGFVVNVKTLEQELGPLSEALSRGASTLKKELDKWKV